MSTVWLKLHICLYSDLMILIIILSFKHMIVTIDLERWKNEMRTSLDIIFYTNSI